MTIRLRAASARTTTRAEEMSPFERRMPAVEKPAQEALQERLSEPCAACRWQEVCLDDGICWDARRLAREAAGRKQRQPMTKAERQRANRARWTREAIIGAIQAWVAQHGQVPCGSEWQSTTETHPSWYRVKGVFGSCSAAIEAAGLEPCKSGRQKRSIH